jgi:hypothetical protein
MGVQKPNRTPSMKIAPSVAELQRENIVLELECIDRMYLNADVPKLTSEKGIEPKSECFQLTVTSIALDFLILSMLVRRRACKYSRTPGLSRSLVGPFQKIHPSLNSAPGHSR